MKYQLVFTYLVLMISQVFGTLQFHKDEKENGISNIHNDITNHSLNEECKTTTTIGANNKPALKAFTTTTLRPTATDTITTSASLSPFRISVPAYPSMRDNTPTTTLRPTATDTITTSASLSPFRISVPAYPSIGMRDNTPLYYNNRFLQIPSGYLSYPRPVTMPFPIYKHLYPSRSNLVGYFYDFPVYKKQVRVGIHFNK